MDNVAAARAYLVKTAQAGGTMARQGVETAISRLNPAFVVPLANAIQAARAEGLNVGVGSSYRPPGFGVGGYADKSNSLHSYGLAVDIAGLGKAGTKAAYRWNKIATQAGLYNPYGPDNGAEYNHYQAVPQKGRQFVETHPGLKTVVPRGSKGGTNLDAMWAAAGLGAPSSLSLADGGPALPAQQVAADVAAGQLPSVPGGLPPTLRKGATDARTGGAVTRLQQQLTDAGYDIGPHGVDGRFGKDTAAAVRQVEQQYNLPTRDRGVAGPQVQAALAGNERLRVIADTRQRFGAPLAPRGSYQPMVAGRPDVPVPSNDWPQQLSIAADVPDQFASSPAMGYSPADPALLKNYGGGPPARDYDTRGVSAGLSSPNVGAANALMQQVAPRQAATPGGPIDPQTLALLQRNVPAAPGSDPATIFQREQLAAAMPGAASAAAQRRAAALDAVAGVGSGRPAPQIAPNTPRGTSINDLLAAWGQAGRDAGGAVVGAGNAVSDFFQGGPPTSTAVPRATPIPPAVPESASPYGGYIPGGYDSGRQYYGIPSRQSSLGDAGSSSTNVLQGGGALEDYLQAPLVGPPAPATVVPAGSVGGPGPVAAGDLFSAGGIYGINADPSRLDPGTLDTGVTGGVPATGLTVDDTGYPDTGVGQPARVAARGVIGAVPYVKPQTTGQRIGGIALRVGANALVPGLGMLVGAIYNSAMRNGGSFDKTQQYTGGPVRDNSLLTTAGGAPALTPYGTRQYQGAYGTVNSPFTPTASGWRAPDFNPISGGASYAYNPETHTYIDSRGNEHPY